MNGTNGLETGDNAGAPAEKNEAPSGVLTVDQYREFNAAIEAQTAALSAAVAACNQLESESEAAFTAAADARDTMPEGERTRQLLKRHEIEGILDTLNHGLVAAGTKPFGWDSLGEERVWDKLKSGGGDFLTAYADIPQFKGLELQNPEAYLSMQKEATEQVERAVAEIRRVMAE